MRISYLPDIFDRQSLDSTGADKGPLANEPSFVDQLHDQQFFSSIASSAESELLQQLNTETISYALNRAQLRVNEHTSAEDVAQLDQEFSISLKAHGSLLRQNTLLATQLYSLAKSVEENRMFELVEKEFVRLGYEAGLAQGRSIENEKLAHCENSKESLLKTYSALEHPLEQYSQEEKEAGKVISMVAALNATYEYHERRGIKTRLAAEASGVKVFRAIGGWRAYIPGAWFKDIVGLQRTLESTNRRELGLVDQAYQAQHDSQLKDVFLKTFRKKHARRLKAYLEHDKPTIYAYKVYDELGAWLHTPRSRAKAVTAIYSELTTKEIKQMEAALNGILRRHKTSVEERFQKLPLTERREISYYRDGKTLQAKAMQLDRTLNGSFWWSRKNLRNQLLELSPTEISEIENSYTEVTDGRSLRKDIISRMPGGPAKDYCLAMLAQDQTAIRAARIACALAYREDWIGTPFLNTSEQERHLLVRDYCNAYGKQESKFIDEVRRNCWADDYKLLSICPPLCKFLDNFHWPTMNSFPFVESILDSGDLTKAELLRYFMVGFGSDVEGIYTVLYDQDKADIEKWKAEYANRYKPGAITKLAQKIPYLRGFILVGDLEHDLRAELSGDSEFDVNLMLEGRPTGDTEREACQALIERLDKRYFHENSGWFLRSSKAGIFRGDRRVLELFDQDYSTARDFYEKHIENVEHPNEKDVIRFRTLVRLAEVQCDAYRSTKVSLGDLFVNLGAGLGATAGSLCAFIIAGATYWNVALLSGIGSLLWRQLVGRSVLGDGYGKDEKLIQGVRAVIDGVSIFWVRVGTFTLGRFFGAQLSSKIAKSGFKSGLHKFVKSLEDSIKRQNKLERFTEHPEEYHLYRGPEEVLKTYRQQLLTGISGTQADPNMASLFLDAISSEQTEH